MSCLLSLIHACCINFLNEQIVVLLHSHIFIPMFPFSLGLSSIRTTRSSVRHVTSCQDLTLDPKRIVNADVIVDGDFGYSVCKAFYRSQPIYTKLTDGMYSI